MKRFSILSLFIFVSVFAFASEDSTKTIKIQSSVVGWYQPDFAVINVTIQEYLLPDASSQNCTPIRLSEIREKLLQLLKPFNVKEKDLEFNGMAEVHQNNFNNFGYANNVAMQPELLSKTFDFKLPNEEAIITKLFEALNSKGIKVTAIFGEYSEATVNKIKVEMLQKCSETSRERVDMLAEMNAFTVDTLLFIDISDEGTSVNPSFNNNYMQQYHVLSIKPVKHIMYATYIYSIK